MSSEIIDKVVDALGTVVKAEKTTTGRVNLFLAFVVGALGLEGKEIFSPTGVFLIVLIIMSAVISDMTKRVRNRSLRSRAYARPKKTAGKIVAYLI